GDLLPFGRLHPVDDDGVGMLSGEIVDLLLQLALAVTGGRGDAAVHRDVRRRRPDEGGQLGPPDVAQDVHFEEAVLGRGETGAELGTGPGRAEDWAGTELLGGK